LAVYLLSVDGGWLIHVESIYFADLKTL